LVRVVPSAPARIVVNLKTYEEATGTRALAIAKAAELVAKSSGIGIAVAPQALDIRLLAGTGVPVYAQHFDLVEGGSQTGWTSLQALAGAGVRGSLINHSEHRVDAKAVAAMVTACRQRKIASIVCTKDASESGRFAALSPDAVAVEPPELIGGDVSVTTADPDVVSSSVEAVTSRAPGVRVYCGAGVKVRRDVEVALELGAFGILLASGVTKAEDPRAVLEDLASGFS
jgi:triosephosphate isomerase (TIM)